MAQKIDSAILRALSSQFPKLDPSKAQIETHGGSGFASTYRISTEDGLAFFVKTSNSAGARSMFEGEHTSLNALHTAVPSLCPQSFAWGQLEDTSNAYFLVTEFLDLSGRSSSSGSGVSLAEKLAKLHTAAVPSEYEGNGFGFSVTTSCGDTPQDNSWKASWSEFFAQNRLMHILNAADKNNGADKALRDVVEQTCQKVVPRLLGDGHLGGERGIKPVVVHGDLWSGNHGWGMFVGREGGGVENVVFDPSCCYGHSEYDHGIMNMFGGFGGSFWKEYFKHISKTEPVEEYEDRVKLYESYHHLNHYSLFGGSYKSGALSILKGLLKKYG